MEEEVWSSRLVTGGPSAGASAEGGPPFGPREGYSVIAVDKGRVLLFGGCAPAADVSAVDVECYNDVWEWRGFAAAGHAGAHGRVQRDAWSQLKLSGAIPEGRRDAAVFRRGRDV